MYQGVSLGLLRASRSKISSFASVRRQAIRRGLDGLESGPCMSYLFISFVTAAYLRVITDTTHKEALTRGAEKELVYLQQFGRPLLPLHRIRRETYKYEPQKPSDHIQNLKKYHLIAPSLVANASPSSDFCIRHPHLRPSHILVSHSPDSNSKSWVVNSIIEWQHTAIHPLSLHAGIAQALQNYNDDGGGSI